MSGDQFLNTYHNASTPPSPDVPADVANFMLAADPVLAQAAELAAKLGVDEAMRDVPGVTLPMMVKFGENDVKTVEDLAGCATDDIVGWTERKEGSEPVKHAGYLDANEMSREDAERMIMEARVVAGWITREDLDARAEPVAEEAEA